MRRTHLRGQKNILKRLLIHVGAFNLSLIFRSMLGAGKPRELKSRHALVSFCFCGSFDGFQRLRNRKYFIFRFDDHHHNKIVAISVIGSVIRMNGVPPRAARARAPRKLGIGIGDDMLRFNVSAATTLPHRGALHTWFCFPAEQQHEYRSECWGVAASEAPAFRRDNGRLDVEARCVYEDISALRTVHPLPRPQVGLHKSRDRVASASAVVK